MSREFDPLGILPNAVAVEQKLRSTEQLAAKLRVLLRTCREVEAAGDSKANTTAAPRLGVRDER